MTAEHQPDAVALAVADDLLDRVGGNAATRFISLGDARFKVLEEDAIDLARVLGAEMPAEDGGPLPSYRRAAFDPDHMPSVGSYVVVYDDKGPADICCVLIGAGHDVGPDVPGAPWIAGEALLAVWHAEDLEGAA